MKITLNSTRREGFLLSNLRVERSEALARPIRIVQLTDLHYGPVTSAAHIKRAVDMALRLKPDCVVLTGDFIQASRLTLLVTINARLTKGRLGYQRWVQSLTRELSELIRPLTEAVPCFAVPGNHDHEEGLRTIVRCLPNSLQWLVNASAVVSLQGKNVGFLGVDDLRLGKPKVPEPIESSFISADYRILLLHNPDFLLRVKKDRLKNFDLALAGHTHGGQIRLPKVGPLLTRTRYRDQCQGLSCRTTVPLYVSQGVGYGTLTLRLNCPPEITLIELA